MISVQNVRGATAQSSLLKAAVSSSDARSDWLVIGLGLIAVLLKLVIAFNTFGSSDAVTFYTFAKSLNADGLEWTYRHSLLFNHPPLTAHFLQLIFVLDQNVSLRSSGLTFPVLLRIPGILADFFVLLVLLKLRPRYQVPRWTLVLCALSPVSLMVSGFHGNTDPVMVLFLVLAAYMCVKNQALLSGLFLALSCQIKIVPLFLVPIFFFFWFERSIVGNSFSRLPWPCFFFGGKRSSGFPRRFLGMCCPTADFGVFGELRIGCA